MAILVRRFGSEHLEDIEDAIQEALIKAMRVWAYQNIPDQPLSWLVRVSHNNLVDSLRKGRRMTLTGDVRTPELSISADELTPENQVEDDQLKLIFMCCHPFLSQESQIILTLKLVLGFGNKEVSNALLKKEEAVAKAYTRAKNKLKETEIRLDHSLEIGLRSRLNIVLKIIYLIFSEGYKPFQGDQIIRRDLCYEAIRLAILLDKNKYCSGPSTKGLIALMCFHTSRFEARQDASGEIISLEAQDRTLWSRELISIGIEHINQATRLTDDPLDYILEAFISYYHCISPSFRETDWKSILKLYDLHLAQRYSPILALNRIIPVSMVMGVQYAYEELLKLETIGTQMSDPVLYYAIKGDLEKRSGRLHQAREAYEQAISLGENVAEIKHLQKKIRELTNST